MSSIYLRGGLPQPFAGTAVAASARQFAIPGGVTNHLYVENLSDVTDLLIYFNKADADAGINGIVIPMKLGTPGNPFDLPVETGCIWLQSVGPLDVSFRVLALVRRG